jgi:hypothetical protein
MRTWSIERAIVGLGAGAAVAVQGLLESLWPARTPGEVAADALAEREAEEEVAEAGYTSGLGSFSVRIEPGPHPWTPGRDVFLGPKTEPHADGCILSADHRGLCCVPDEPPLTDDELVALRGLIDEHYPKYFAGAAASLADGGSSSEGVSSPNAPSSVREDKQPVSPPGGGVLRPVDPQHSASPSPQDAGTLAGDSPGAERVPAPGHPNSETVAHSPARHSPTAGAPTCPPAVGHSSDGDCFDHCDGHSTTHQKWEHCWCGEHLNAEGTEAAVLLACLNFRSYHAHRQPHE